MRCRKITESDKPTISKWISRDPDHSKKKMTAEFFFVPETLPFAIEDETGVVMFVRIDLHGAAAVMHIQFDEGERRRTAIALIKSFPIVRDSAKSVGARAIIFDSVSPSLIAFCKKRLGFQALPNVPDHYIAFI